jgi:hypothetical protein
MTMSESYTYRSFDLKADVATSEFSDLVGKTLVRIEGMEPESDRVDLFCDDGSRYVMYHSQNCCESVYLAEVIGDVPGLLGVPIVVADVDTRDGSGEKVDEGEYTYERESATWTFYTLRTIHSTVVLRWLGESNGYYSEEVDFVRLIEE